MTSHCLIEIGTEELPPRALRTLAQDFARLVQQGLTDAELGAQSVEVFATPRRLAMLLTDLPMQQADRQIEKRGPALAAAFDADGNPSKAASGFARSCGVEVADLERRETDKGSWLYFRASAAGKSVKELLPAIVQTALSALPIPKRMRWGDRDDEFVRPVKWLVLMLDGEVVDAEMFGLRSGNYSYGHRFHAPGPLHFKDAGDYAATLLSQGMVIASYEERRNSIRDMVEQAAFHLGGQARIDDNLLDEVTGLVEYPVVVCGEFDAAFLRLPAEVLVTTMQNNQKYFALFGSDGDLLPHFISIANIDSRKPDVVAKGNERVIRPRFADAEFFFSQDQKQGLEAMRGRLDAVVFQKKLGSLGDKTRRVSRLAQLIGEQLDADATQVVRAAGLCKADLMSDMVGEFPGLQGIIGRYYAALQQEDAAVCEAIEQHYWPRHAGDRLPESALSQAVALADRLDSLVGIFAIGEKPGGDKDPFALRRAALAVLRILVEKQLALDVHQLCRWAADGFPAELGAEGAIDAVIAYIFDRQRAYYQDLDTRFDIVDAVAHDLPGQLYDCDLRIRAVQAFQQHEAAAALAAANKRISNILKKQSSAFAVVDPELLEEAAELELYRRIKALEAEVNGLFTEAKYREGLERLAGLRPAVDRFFDEVMVMTESAALQNNRLALLDELLQSFRRVADFSRIQS
jgi:glycyl-tRNA synthetase beta chain